MLSKIIVIRRDNIGDLVCTTPLLKALRDRFPAARIDALVNSYNRPVLAANGDVDHVYAYTKAKHRAPGETVLGAHWRRFLMLNELRRVGYDLAILANDGDVLRAVKFTRWIRPKQVAGFLPRGHASVPGIDLPVAHDDVARHAVEYALRLLEPLQVRCTPPGLRLRPEEAFRSAAEKILRGQPWYDPSHPTVAIHISARKVPQRWPVERFAQLIHRLRQEYGAQFMLFWSPGDDDNPLHPGDDRKAQAILEATRGLPVLPYATQRLEELMGGLAACDSVVCSDGGAMHLAAGLGKPIVCFFGNSDATRWHPWGVPHELLQKPSRDVRDISVDEAFDAFARLRERSNGPV